MALREITHEADIDLFRQELVNLIDLRHSLCVLAGFANASAPRAVNSSWA
jgi:hypothetical protein